MGPSIVLFALTAALSQAQPRYTEYGQQTERGGTRVSYWDNEKNPAAGQVAIDTQVSLFDAPLTFESPDGIRERLVTELSEERLVIEWGSFALSAPVAISHR